MTHTRVLTTALIVLAFSGATAAQAQGRGRGQDQKDHKDDKHQDDRHDQVPQQEQQRRIQQEQQRSSQFRQHLDQQVPVMQQRAEELKQQQRLAQYRAQQEYAARLQQQQRAQQLQAQRNYAIDPYINTPHNYRYGTAGNYRQTNQYGVDVLREAVNNGYQEGVRAGQADRQDRWPSNFRNAPEYRDANYGYTGNYIDRADYNNYFRQGFQRGYQDGYNSRSQYGTTTNGSTSILGNILTTILGLQPIR